jgi:hypothetical protein
VPPEAAAVMVEQNVTAALARELGQDKLIGLLESKAVRLSAFSTAQLATFFAATPPPTAPPPPPTTGPAAASVAATAELRAATEAAAARAAEAASVAAAEAAAVTQAASVAATVLRRQQAASATPLHTQAPPEGAAEPLSSVDLARGMACLEAAKELGGDLEALLAPVPAEEAALAVVAMAGLFESTSRLTLTAGWNPGMVISMLQPQVHAAFRAVGCSVEAALAQVPSTVAPANRAANALASACSGPAVSRSGGHVRGDPVSTGASDTMRQAAMQLGSSKAGVAAISNLERLARSAAASADASEAFLQAVRLLELDEVLGPHISALLHQEKMVNAPSGERNLNSAACSVWASVVEVRERLGAARARAFTEVMPKGLDALAVVTAVNVGKITLELLCGDKKLQPSEVRMAAARAWPVFVAISLECFPRQAAAVQLGLLRVASDAFDLASCGPTTVKAIEPVFTEMTRLTEVYSTSGGILPSWSAARKATTVLRSKKGQLKNYFEPEPAPPRPWQHNGGLIPAGADAAAYGKQQQALAAAAASAKAAAAAKTVAEKKAAEAAAAKVAK